MTAAAKLDVEEERCPVCSYSLAAHRKQPPERSQFVCDLYLGGDTGVIPKWSRVRPKIEPKFFGLKATD